MASTAAATTAEPKAVKYNDFVDMPKCPFDASYGSKRADGPQACKWYPGSKEASPHVKEVKKEKKILDTILDHIGNTPLVRLNKIPQAAGVECEILAKCEYFNAGGSVKDRIGRRMVLDAEASGRIKKGDTLIEPTSGNTGIGLALTAAIKGYKMIITLPEKMSQEKVDVLKALGAEIIRTPTEAAFDSPESHIGVANKLNREIPNSHILDQYSNPSNPLAHYEGTAEEILAACDGKIDMLVAGAGTGGTLTGTARKIKERCPDCIIVGVDPIGSILAEPESLNDYKRLEGYEVEGIGYDFIPKVLDREIVDFWVKTHDRDALIMARRLIKEEGLLCGGSSGTAVTAALEAAKRLKKGQRCVVILPDSVRNYMSKFLNDDWMWERGHVDADRSIGVSKGSSNSEWWHSKLVSDLSPQAPSTVLPTVKCSEAVTILAKGGFDQLPVVSADGEVLGVVTEGNLASKLTSGRVKPNDPVTKVQFTRFRKVSMTTKLKDLSRMFDRDHYALVLHTQRSFASATSAPTEKTMVFGIVTRIDLLKYITSHSPSGSPAASPTAGGGAGAGAGAQ